MTLRNIIKRLDKEIFSLNLVHTYNTPIRDEIDTIIDNLIMVSNDFYKYAEQTGKVRYGSYRYRTTQEFPSSSGVTSGYKITESQDPYVQNTSPAIAVIQASLFTCGD